MARRMKPSGIEWIGDIPEGWEIVRLRYLANLFTGNSLNDEEKELYSSYSSGIPYVSTKDIDLESNVINYDNGLMIPQETCTLKIAPKQNLLICIEGGNAGKKIGFLAEDVCFVNKLCCFQANKKSFSKFIYYYSKCHCFAEQFNTCISGLMGGVSTQQLKNFSFVNPPLPEQQAIADYLDRKSELIDSTIEKQKTVIEKLKLYKQSIITEAVTKGLNPTVKMKPSGIEWIGDIPEGWNLSKVKFVTSKIGSGVTPRGGSEVYVETGIIFLRSQNIYNEGIRIEDVVYIPEEIDKEMESTRVFRNDILLNITGGSIGRCCIFPKNIGSANVNQHVCIIRPIEGLVNASYLHYFFIGDCGVNYINVFQSGANREGLNFKQIENMYIPYPPLSEQQAIADYLDQKCSQIDIIIEQKLKLIEKLSSYKKSLIYECVTGKREVMEA